MPASACLRISLNLSDEKLARLEAIGPLVAKVTSAFLEGRWRWPKRYALETPFIFNLIDPKADTLDFVAIDHLAEELQLKLFGTSDTGEVTLLLLDANEDDTAHFVRMEHAAIRDAIKEPMKPTPFGGRLLKIETGPHAVPGLRWRTLERETPKAAENVAGPPPAGSVRAELRGIYFTPRQSFIGSGVAAAAPDQSSPFSLVDGADRLPVGHAEEFDMNALQAAMRCLSGTPFTGVLFLPICFSSLMRRSTREFYEALIRTLPVERRNQLAASVYDVPRAPSFHAVAQMYDILSPSFSSIDLQVEDPGFEIEHLPLGTVTSVTYRLPKADDRQRLSAARKFMSQRDAFKRLKIWPAITNVRTVAELRVCLQERTSFLTGAAICGATNTPVGVHACGVGSLPLTRAA